MSWTVDHLLIGAPVNFRGGEQSAIAKTPVSGPVFIGELGLSGDHQADKIDHGGPEMAVHQYPQDHHAFWREQIGDHALLSNAGAFGTNLVVTGMRESDIWIGDRFRLGDAVLEACQPRQPCWKIEHRFDQKAMVKKIIKSGHCGWFYRVIETGNAQAGDALIRMERGDEAWSMARIFKTIWGVSKDPAEKPTLAEMQELAVHLLLPEKLKAKLVTKIRASLRA